MPYAHRLARHLLQTQSQRSKQELVRRTLQPAPGIPTTIELPSARGKGVQTKAQGSASDACAIAAVRSLLGRWVIHLAAAVLE